MHKRKFLLLIPLLSAAWASPVFSSLTPSTSQQQGNLPLTGFSTRSRQARHFRLLTEEEVRLEKRNLPDEGQVTDFGGNKSQPVRGALGAPFYHPSNSEIDKQNPDNVSPPTTDSGVIPNLKWSFSLSHTRLLKGGWVREQTITDLPVSKDFAAAELTLAPYAYRELHWHRVVEWAIVLAGNGRIAAVASNGTNYISDVGPGDLWYFPSSVPHSIQALDEGLEFLVLFGDGNFDSQGTTFMASDFAAHVPKEVLAHNLGVNVSELNNIPQKDPYIIPATKKPGSVDQESVKSPVGTIPNPFVYKLSQQPAEKKKGGEVKIADSTNFFASKEVASALVSVQPGGLRELHWHPSDEWFYVVSGKGRITAFAGNSASRTFDVGVGDSGVVPNSYGHYVENYGTEPLVFIEVFKAPVFSDFSFTQWLALTPHQIVADTLNISLSIAEVNQRFATIKQ
ncbi:Bicupin, oxalate decarboxylase/oxidase [Meredithblackwellia eburnea MCA 4105]